MADYLDDLDDLSSDDEASNETGEVSNSSLSETVNGSNGNSSNGNGATSASSMMPPPPPSLVAPKSVTSVCSLLRSPAFISHLGSLSSGSTMEFDPDSHSVVESPDYKKILKSNKYLVELEEEVSDLRGRVHHTSLQLTARQPRPD